MNRPVLIIVLLSFFLSSCVDKESYVSLIPIDFSGVGYHSGNDTIPRYPVSVILTPPADGADATELIQNAIDHAEIPGAILLKRGTYNITGSLRIERDGVVLRGEGNETVLKACGEDRRSLITLGLNTERVVGEGSDISDQYTPVGQKWVNVADASLFRAGDRVSVYFLPSESWISGLRMDRLTQNEAGNVKQWTADEYSIRWERQVTGVDGNKVLLDNPIVMELDRKYARKIRLEHVSWDRVKESGVENMMMVSECDPEDEFDEDHAWTAVDIKSAEHCWVRDVKSANFAYCLVNMLSGAKNITVRNCVSTCPVSQLKGSRRYAFHILGGEMCLVEGCYAEYDRHGFVTAARTPGPNVFVDCVMDNAYAGVGPHQRWASGVLYDNCNAEGARLEVEDRDNWGSGHGWAGVSHVFWNCNAGSIVCQNPWIGGENWCVGCIGEKKKGRDHDDGLERPDGNWHSHGAHVWPKSLYRYQLEKRIVK